MCHGVIYFLRLNPNANFYMPRTTHVLEAEVMLYEFKTSAVQ